MDQLGSHPRQPRKAPGSFWIAADRWLCCSDPSPSYRFSKISHKVELYRNKPIYASLTIVPRGHDSLHEQITRGKEWDLSQGDHVRGHNLNWSKLAVRESDSLRFLHKESWRVKEAAKWDWHLLDWDKRINVGQAHQSWFRDIKGAWLQIFNGFKAQSVIEGDSISTFNSDEIGHLAVNCRNLRPRKWLLRSTSSKKKVEEGIVQGEVVAV